MLDLNEEYFVGERPNKEPAHKFVWVDDQFYAVVERRQAYTGYFYLTLRPLESEDELLDALLWAKEYPEITFRTYAGLLGRRTLWRVNNLRLREMMEDACQAQIPQTS